MLEFSGLLHCRRMLAGNVLPLASVGDFEAPCAAPFSVMFDYYLLLFIHTYHVFKDGIIPF